jgi:hypothetical protein
VSDKNVLPDIAVHDTKAEVAGYCLLAVAAAALGSSVFAQPHAAAARTPEVWFAPNDDHPRGPNGDLYLNYDFPHLFDPKPAVARQNSDLLLNHGMSLHSVRAVSVH